MKSWIRGRSRSSTAFIAAFDASFSGAKIATRVLAKNIHARNVLGTGQCLGDSSLRSGKDKADGDGSETQSAYGLSLNSPSTLPLNSFCPSAGDAPPLHASQPTLLIEALI